MRKIILFLVSVFLLPAVLGVGGWDEGGWDEGGWDFGTPAPEPTLSSPSSSGGGGGGGSSYIPADFSKPVTLTLNIIRGQTYTLNINSELHTYSITQIDVENQQAEFVFESEKHILLLNLNKPELLNYNNDGYLDFEITLTKIYGGNELVEIVIKSIHILIQPEVSGISGIGEPEPIIEVGGLNIVEERQQIEIEKEPETTKEEVEESGINYTLLKGIGLLMLALVIFMVSLYFYFKSKKKYKEGKEKKEKNKEG